MRKRPSVKNYNSGGGDGLGSFDRVGLQKPSFSQHVVWDITGNYYVGPANIQHRVKIQVNLKPLLRLQCVILSMNHYCKSLRKTD